MRSFVLLLLPFLSGCDAWPTVVDNRTDAQLMVRYLQKDYDHWSSSFAICAGKAMPLARDHWIRDIRAIQIRDGARLYSLSGDGMRLIQDACPSTEMERHLSTAGNCYLIYLGKGRLQTLAVVPQGVEYEQVGNGS